MELYDFLVEQAQELRTIALDKGIMWPFLYRRRTNSMIVAKPIKTKRVESLNVCWACLQEGKLTPNGIFFSFDEGEHDSNILEVKYHPFFISDVQVVASNQEHGLFTIAFRPTNDEYSVMFTCYDAIYIRDKRELRG